VRQPVSIPREFKELLLAKINLVDLVQKHIPSLKPKSNNNYFACCPFHDEKSASFSVSQIKQFYYCFGCGAHGNAIDFLMQYERLGFREAIQSLADMVNMTLPQDTHASEKKDKPLPDLYDLMEKIKLYYYAQLRKAPAAIQYLKNRGITSKIAQQFCLGFALPGWDNLLQHLGHPETERKKLIEAGMLIKKQESGFYDRFRDRIIFPIEDYRGRTIGFGGRILHQGEPKYLNSPETPLFQKGRELYGLYQALKANRKLEQILIVEGYMDVIALFQYDITYAAATLGTATTAHHLQILMRYTANIIFCFDGDLAGKNAAWRALQVALPCLQDQLQIRFLFLPDGEDPDTLIRKEGKAAFEKRLQTAVSLSDFFFQHMIEQNKGTASLESRSRLIAMCLPYIKNIPPGIFQHLLLDELSKRARVDKNEILIQLEQKLSKPPISQFSQTIPEPILSKSPPCLETAMTLLVQYPPLAKKITSPLPESQLPGYALFTQLIEIIKQNEILSTGILLESWRGKKEEKYLVHLAKTEQTLPEQGIENEFIGSIKQIILLTYEEVIHLLMKKAALGCITPDEKRELSTWINKKKALITPA
jgi:DNA primase